ncbi:MAG: urease accessory protein UreD [Deltaproteobacteria bacterium]
MLDLGGNAVMERVKGEARVRLAQSGLREMYQAGSAKVMLPKTDAVMPEVVFLNTAGGLTSGDLLDYTLTLEAGVLALAATQTAERAYRATLGPARVDLRFDLGKGAQLNWLPQETILFDHSDLTRTTRVDLAGDAQVLICEIIVLGRAAMGETVRSLNFTDRRDICRDGRLIHREAMSPVPEQWHSIATLNGQAAFASLVMTGQGLDAALPALRAVLSGEAEASAFDGRLTLRALARDLFPLKRLMARAITTLTKAPLPRVWQI